MKAKQLESNLIPLVKLGKARKDITGVTAVQAYALCKICNQLLSAYATHWAKNGLKCPNCKTMTHYVKNEWYKGKIPLITDESVFNVMNYMPQGVTPRRFTYETKSLPTATQPVETPSNGTNQNQAMLVLLQNIYAELQKLNDKWS